MKNKPNLQSPKRRRILVCVTGLSPQIVTETLYALSVKAQPAWVPHEVWLITTAKGAEHANNMLLKPPHNWFNRLIQDWQLPKISFNQNHIHVLQNSQGEPMQDILDDYDNQKAADGISNFIRSLADQDDTEIHASIAGGRKTMGFYMGYAMSLWGRNQDRLSHVLVSQRFEAQPNFFYPAPVSTLIEAMPHGVLDTSTANVWLGDIPFVHLRCILPPSILKNQYGFAQTVQIVNQSLDEVRLVIDPANKQILINEQAVRLMPMQLCILAVLAYICAKQLEPLKIPSKYVDVHEWTDRFLKLLRQAIGQRNIPGSVDKWFDRFKKTNRIDALQETFSQQMSKLNRVLRNSTVVPLNNLICKIQGSTTSKQSSYCLKLLPHNISFLVNPSL